MKYLSKLLSMFLVGMMLVATGCTDYDQDIKNLQNDVNELESQLNGKLATLDTKLDTVKESLTGAINAAKEELDGKLKTAVDELKAADQKNEDAIDAANKEIAAAVTRIATLETQLAALTSELNALEGKHDADIKAVRDELATQIAAVNTKIADEVAKLNSAIDEANKKIAANEGAIDALEEKDVELAKSIKDAFDAIEKNAEAIEKNAEAIQKNADDILANANAISVNADAIDALESSLLELTNNYAAYKAATDAAIAVLESRMDTAEAAIVELEKAVEELYSLHDVQGALIENLDGRLEEFMQYVEDQFAVLAAADKALNDLIVNLENSFIDYQKIVDEQFTKAFAQIAANTATINALAAKHEEEVKSLAAQDAAILVTLDQHVAWMMALEESISAVSDRVGATEALIGKIQTNIAAMQVSIDALVNDVAELEKTLADFQKQVGEQIARIDAAIKSALVEAKEYTDARHDEAAAMIEALQTAVERELLDIKSALDKVTDHAKAIDDKLAQYMVTNNEALEGLRKTIEEVKADLVNNHIKPLEVKLDQFINDVKATLAAYEKKISDLNLAIGALQEADERQDAAIEQAIEDILANLAEINTLKSKLEELEGKHNADIDTLRAELEYKAEEILATLETVTGELLGALEDVKNELSTELGVHETRLDAIDEVIEKFNANFEALAETIETIQDDISGIQGQLGKLETTIGAMQTSIDTLTNGLISLNESFVAYQGKTDAAILDLTGRMEAAEGAILDLEDAVVDLNNKHNAQQAILDGHTTDIEDIKKFVTDTTATLTKVAGQISTLEANLDKLSANLGELSGRVDNIYTELTKAIGENAVKIQQISAQLEAEIAARKADDTAIKEAMKEYLKQMATFVKEHTANELKALEEKINKRISELEKRVGELETNLANLEKDHAELENTVKEAIQNLTDIINTAIENAAADAKKKADTAEENAKKFAEALAIELSDKLDAVKGHLTNVEAFAKQTKNELDEYKKATDAILDDLQNQINEIKNRVQSIVFVPEYSDGKGTINYAMAGRTLVETRSMMVYQVYPADCAAAIEEAFGKNPESLTYNFEGLKTRSSEPEFNVVEVKAGSTGRLFVTFETRNLGENFYAGKMEYALSLVHQTEIVNLSTVYTNVVPAAEYDEISMAIMYGDEEIKGCYNPASEKNLAYQFEYTDTETIVDVLPEHYVAFTVAGKTYKGIKELNAAGYALELKCDKFIHREWNEEYGTLPFDVADANEDGILEVKVKEVDGAKIWNTLQVGYTYTAGTLKSTAYSDFVTVPVQAGINFKAVSANWTYSKDANVDANNSGAYTRVLPLTVVDHNLPEDVKSVAEVIALTPNSVKVTLNGEDTSVAAKLIAKGEEMFLEIANFAWDKAYDIEAKYSVMKNGLPVVEATAKIAFNTTDRNREPITINFDPAVAKFERNLQLTNEISDNMDVAYELLVFGNENYDIDCEKYLAENFVVDYTYVDALIADGKKVDVLEPNTMLAIDGVNNGKNIYTAFCYADFDFVPAQVEYTKTVTTWYGQEFIINKVLNFEFPVYDFKHNSKYVYGGGFDFYSQVHPEYTWNNDDETQGLLKFDVAAVDLRAAFSVVDAEGKALSDDQLAALSLSYNFEIEDNNHDGIEINTNDELSYYGANPFVNVRGNLVITNDNGAEYVVPTSFDEGGKYASYNVVKFNPIGTAEVISNPTVKVNNSIAYTIHILDYVKLMDHRTGGRQNYDLITDGAWVSGNGLNGFAEGVDVRADYMYRITETWVDDYSDVDPEIRPYITMNNGTLTFDNSQQLELTAPFTIPVTLKFQNCWMETPQQVTVKVTFNPIK